MNERELIIDIKENGVSSKHIEALITMHKEDRARMHNMYERYKVSVNDVPVFNHDPVKQYEDFETGGNVRRIDQYVNNKLNNAFDVEIVDSRVGYMHGKPISYKDDDEIEHNVITEFNMMNNTPDKDSETGKMAAICGYGARLIYIDTEGHIRLKNLKPYNTVFVGEDMTEPLYAMHYYPIRDTDKGLNEWYAEFYDDTHYYVFKGNLDGMQFVDRYEHLADYVPLFGVPNNTELLGDAERVIHLIDAYDRTISDASSEISQTRLAYLVLRGAGLDEEEIQNLKQTGVFELFDKEQDVSYLTKDVNDTMIENHLDRLEKNIMRFSKSVNFNSDEFNGNVPVIGMHLKLMALENKCITFERKFTAMLRYQFKVLYNLWNKRNVLSVGDTDYLNVQFTFTRNMPVNKLEEAQLLSMLNGQVSDATRYSTSTLVEDAEAEKQLMSLEDMVMADDTRTD
jgi:SPP1 family phage portal protein